MLAQTAWEKDYILNIIKNADEDIYGERVDELCVMAREAFIRRYGRSYL
jgi:hypothetical protein